MRNLFLIIFMLLSSAAFCQITEYSPEISFRFQPVIQDIHHHSLNFYDFAGNPAGLFQDESVFSLQTGGTFTDRSGPYRLISEPDRVSRQQFSVQMVKPLTESDIFKGYFGFGRQTDFSLTWFHQSRLTELNTMVLGDSSTGDFVLDGIFWNGEWAHRFGRRLVTAVSLYYNVDHRLKQLFPKPENRHRDIHARIGLQYSGSRWEAGMVYLYFDEQEKVELTRYNLNQDLTPVLYKFRFSDLPVILLGKTSEERNMEYGGPLMNVHFSRTLGEKHRLFAQAYYSRSDGDITDGGSQPQAQGSFKRNDAGFSAVASFSLSRKAQLRAEYQYNQVKFTNRPPDFDLDAVEHSLADHLGRLSVRGNLNHTFTVFAELSYRNLFKKYIDRMTVNFYQLTISRYFLAIGTNLSYSERWDQQFWAGAGLNDIRNDNRSDNRYSSFFDALFIRTFEYYRQQDTAWGTGTSLTYHYGPIFDLTITGELNMESAENFIPGNDRNEFILTISLKFFIL